MKSILFMFLALVTMLSGTGYAVPLNGGFESGDLTVWEILGDASIQTSAFGSGTTQGTYQAVLTNDILAFAHGDTTGEFPGHVYPLSGVPAGGPVDSFLGLPPDTLLAITQPPHPPSNITMLTGASAIKQTFYGTVGSELSFDWNYLTNDGYNYDYSFVSLVSSDLMFVEKLAGNDPFVSPAPLVASNTIFDNETGFRTFSFILPETGAYTLGIGVTGVEDNLYDSGLIVDNVRISSVPEPTTMFLIGIGLAGVAGLRKRFAGT